jgi:eukaryotic-like serine/threonine-protein kinase
VDERGARLIGALLERRYRIDALLARGGMSSVYRGMDTRLDRRVAIKVMDARFADDRTFVDRFEREARSAAKVHHPHVVAVHDQGVDANPEGALVYLVMELVDGGTLRDLITERGTLDTALACSIMEPVLGALAAAHRAGLVHRDVKPENVLIGHGPEHGTVVKVGDFGLVRAVSSAGTTSKSVILGTVSYLSPEQVTTGAATAQGDVYSAGILLYEMLTGEPPYTGDNPLSVAYRHVNDDVPPPSQRVAGLPPALDELVVRATRRDPAARPADGNAFLAELSNLRTQLALPQVAIPVPEPTVRDRTVPVTPIPNPPAAGTVGAHAAEPADDPEATSRNVEALKVGQPAATQAAPVGNHQETGATVMRPMPVGFQAMGPQGTRAMLRTNLDPGPPSAPYGMPAGLPGSPPQSPAAGLAIPPMPPPPPPRRPRRPRPPGQQPPPRKKGRGNIVLWSLAGVLTLALIATTTWWFSSGRYATVPDVAGQTGEIAEQTLSKADLATEIRNEWNNTVASGEVIRTEPAQGAELIRGDTVVVVVSNGPPRVPDVGPGTTVEDAKQQIRNAGLQPGVDDGNQEFSDEVPKGKVVRLDPNSGTTMRLGERVEIIVSKGAEPKPIPDLRGKSRDDAFDELEDLGLKPVDAPQQFDPDIEGGDVIGTNPGPGVVLNPGTEVQVATSNAVTIPDLANQNPNDAAKALQDLGLQVQVQQFGGAGRVFGTNPGANSRVAPGSVVVLITIP